MALLVELNNYLIEKGIIGWFMVDLLGGRGHIDLALFFWSLRRLYGRGRSWRRIFSLFLILTYLILEFFDFFLHFLEFGVKLRRVQQFLLNELQLFL